MMMALITMGALRELVLSSLLDSGPVELTHIALRV